MDWQGYEVGKKVVCISVDDDPIYANVKGLGIEGIEVGKIYTVKWCGMHNFALDTRFAISLVEVTRLYDVPFGAFRFKPVRETSIDCFKEHLTNIPILEDA